MPALGADQLAYLTTRIDVVTSEGRGRGTGFFVRLGTAAKPVDLVVTNKHVVEGATEGSFIFDIADTSGDRVPGGHITVPIVDFESKWVKHPDPEVDLAAFDVAPIVSRLATEGRPLHWIGIGKDMLADQAYLDDLQAMEDIVMVGYPTGLWDHANNRPIIRRGITATPAYDKFEGRPEFMIDCACFPGSSGSPIILYTGATHINKKTGGSVLGTPKVKLLGVLYGGPVWNADGDVKVRPIPTSAKLTSTTPIMMNLGFCVRAECLLWFDHYFSKPFRSLLSPTGNFASGTLGSLSKPDR